MAPLLYSILIYDFPHIDNDSQSILYADDSLIYAHDISPINALILASDHLEKVNRYYKKWGIKINPNKCEAVCIRNASGKCPYFVVPESKRLSLSLEGIEIPFRDSIKYLGITLNKLFKFNQHARSVKSKVNRIKQMFSKLLVSRHLSQDTKLLIYKVSIRSALIYGFPVWFTISPTVAKELEILERSVLRLCVNRNYESYIKRFSNRFIYDKSKIMPLLSYALNSLDRYSNRLKYHENDLMLNVVNKQSEFDWTTNYYLFPLGILNENISYYPSSPESPLLPEFFKTSLPHTHRG